jgi:serine/threonine-protein kinase
MPCLDDNAVNALIEGRLSEDAARDAHGHLAVCEECRTLVAAVRASSTATSAETHDLLTGQLLMNTYRVQHVIGSGAMGTVYAGEHVRLTRPVAIKVLGDRMRHHPDALERFKREAQVCSKLGNPHIIDVLDFNLLPDGTPFMVMERLEGEDLAQKLAIDGALAPGYVIGLMRQIASALANAHDEGVLHRDLKPSNIYLCHGDEELDPFVKVLDFGISKVRGALATLTGSQEILGTPFYMSPEMAMARHAEVDQRSDLFSLGAIAYEALSSRRAFESDSIPGALYRIVHEEPEPLENATLPHGLVRLISRLLSKDRSGRPEHAREVLDELHRLDPQDTSPGIRIKSATDTVNPYAKTAWGTAAPETVKTSRGRRWAWLALTGALVAVAAVIGVVMMQMGDGEMPSATPPPTTADVSPTPTLDAAPPDTGPPDTSPTPDARQPAAKKTTKRPPPKRRPSGKKKKKKKVDTDPIL